jgi:hypothetical protein
MNPHPSYGTPVALPPYTSPPAPLLTRIPGVAGPMTFGSTVLDYAVNHRGRISKVANRSIGHPLDNLNVTLLLAVVVGGLSFAWGWGKFRK